MTNDTNELYLIDAHNFNEKSINPLTSDRRVAYTGYLYNDKGPNLTVDEYLAHPKVTPMVSPKVVTWEELKPLIAESHRRLYTDKPPGCVSSAEFDEMKGVLPPMNLGTRAGMEYYLISERLTGSITTMYARLGEYCLVKYVDVFDRTTWIDPSDFKCIVAA